MRYFWILICILLLCNCSSENNRKEKETDKKYKKFNGNYNTTFNDLQDLHIGAAEANGVGPLTSRADTATYAKDLIRLPNELEIYKIDDLKHSVPYLVPKASELLTTIGLNFRDSLISKKLPLYKLIVTSVTRTEDDVQNLTKRNKNASDNSAHRYGTTFDIAWVRYAKINAKDEHTLDDGRLKAVLGQVLNDLRERDKCYIKHEKKQSCFHITVR